MFNIVENPVLKIVSKDDLWDENYFRVLTINEINNCLFIIRFFFKNQNECNVIFLINLGISCPCIVNKGILVFQILTGDTLAYILNP